MQAGVLNQGVETARNLAPDPRCVSVSNYRVVGSLSSAEESGIPFIRVRRNLSQAGLYIDPSVNFTTSGYAMNVGDTVTVSAEIRVTKAFDLQVRINTFSGASLTYLDQPMVSLLPTDGWVRVSATATISGVSGTGYLRAFIRAFPDNAGEGHGFDVRRYMVTLNNSDSGYFDGSTPDNQMYDFEWSGAVNNSASVRRLPANSDVLDLKTRVLVNGLPRPVGNWSFERDLKGDLPAQVVAAGGVSQASGSITWESRNIVSDAPMSPWGTDSEWIPKSGDKVEIVVTNGTTEWTQFVGRIDTTSGSIGGDVVSNVIDMSDNLSKTVDIPALMASMPPITSTGEYRRVGLSVLFYLNAALRQAGFYSSPKMEAGCVLDAPLQGSHYPLRGNITACSSATGPNGNFSTVSAPWGSASRNLDADYSPSISRSASTPVQLMMMKLSNPEGTSYLRANYTNGYVEVRVTPSAVSASVSGSPVITLPVGSETIVEALFDGSSVELRTNNGRSAQGTSTALPSGTLDSIKVFADSLGAVGPVQVSHPTLSSQHFASIPFEASADLRMGTSATGVEAMPAFSMVPASEIIDEISAKTLRPFWIDETGKARVVATDLLSSNAPVRSLSTLNDICSLNWASSYLSMRSEVLCRYLVPVISSRRTASVEVWSESENVVLSSDETHQTLIEPSSSEDWIMVDENFDYIGLTDFTEINKGIGSIAGGIYTDGVNETYASLPSVDKLEANVEKLGSSKWKYSAKAKTVGVGHQVELRTVSENFDGTTGLWPMWWGKSLPIVRAKAKVEWTEETLDPIPASTIGKPLELDFGPWITGLEPNRTNAINEVAQYVANQVTKPHPEIEDVQIVFDPRLQLGDVVIIDSSNFLGIKLTCLITGNSVTCGEDGIRQSLKVKVISAETVGVTYEQFAKAWPTDSTYASFANAWEVVSTYSDFNNDPLRGSE